MGEIIDTFFFLLGAYIALSRIFKGHFKGGSFQLLGSSLLSLGHEAKLCVIFINNILYSRSTRQLRGLTRAYFGCCWGLFSVNVE